MLCRVCNSRIRPGGTACPNCGSHSIVRSPTMESGTGSKLPPRVFQPDPEDPESQPSQADDARRPETPEAVEVDVDTQELTEVELNEPAEVAATEADGSDADEKEELVPAAGGLDAAGLRGLLADQPDLLEPGLSVYRNEKGTRLGAGYMSAVGEIDLLARDSGGGLVVVMVADRGNAAKLVSGVLERIGWVRKHLAQTGAAVRGIVLLDGARQDIAYAATAVAGTVTFKTWRVAVRFDDVEY